MLNSTTQRKPLPERLRPTSLEEYVGQEHLIGPNAILRKMIDAGNISSFILWGPPGVGKTTLARIIASKLDRPFYTLSAISSGVKDIRDVIRATHITEDGEEERAANKYEKLSKKERQKVINNMEKEMKEAAKALDFERAAELRDLILELKVEG